MTDCYTGLVSHLRDQAQRAQRTGNARALAEANARISRVMSGQARQVSSEVFGTRNRSRGREAGDD